MLGLIVDSIFSVVVAIRLDSWEADVLSVSPSSEQKEA